MHRPDFGNEEGIRRWPVWFARLANRALGWTNMYCAGGCGYPITGFFSVDVDVVNGVPVSMMVCSIDSDCARQAEKLTTTDSDGMRYSEVRPELLTMETDVDRYRLHFTR